MPTETPARPRNTPTPAALHTLAAHQERFTPRRFLRNPHLQTIAGNFLPRPHPLPTPEVVLVTTEPVTTESGTQILCHCHWQPSDRRPEAPTAIIVHGLEGSSASQYVLGNAAKLFRSGANVIRMNMRNCGGPEYDMAGLTPTSTTPASPPTSSPSSASSSPASASNPSPSSATPWAATSSSKPPANSA